MTDPDGIAKIARDADARGVVSSNTDAAIYQRNNFSNTSWYPPEFPQAQPAQPVPVTPYVSLPFWIDSFIFLGFAGPILLLVLIVWPKGAERTPSAAVASRPAPPARQAVQPRTASAASFFDSYTDASLKIRVCVSKAKCSDMTLLFKIHVSPDGIIRDFTAGTQTRNGERDASGYKRLVSNHSMSVGDANATFSFVLSNEGCSVDMHSTQRGVTTKVLAQTCDFSRGPPKI